jgi:hypothetical protein
MLCEIVLTCEGLLWRESLRCFTHYLKYKYRFRLSAYLFRETQNSTYATAAQLSTEFIYRHMSAPSNDYIVDSIDIGSCKSNNAQLTYNSAFYIEGSVVLANTTNNASLSDM